MNWNQVPMNLPQVPTKAHTLGKHQCIACEQTIPNGMAVLRSVSLALVAYHRDCYTVVRATR